MAQQSIQSMVFSRPVATKLSASSASNEETLEKAEKSIKPPAVKQRKLKEWQQRLMRFPMAQA